MSLIVDGNSVNIPHFYGENNDESNHMLSLSRADDELSIASMQQPLVTPEIQTNNIMIVCSPILMVISCYGAFGYKLNGDGYDTIVHDEYPVSVDIIVNVVIFLIESSMYSKIGFKYFRH